MRISELSEATGVPIPRIKYYIREGLVPRGDTALNPGGYDDSHVHRVRLVRALVTVGGMPIDAARTVVDEIDADDPSIPKAVGPAISAISRRPTSDSSSSGDRAEKLVDSLIESRGWTIADDEPARAAFSDAVATMLDMDLADMLGHLEVYAEAADRIADADIASIDGEADLSAIVAKTLVGTVLGEVFISSLRKLAHADRARRMFWPQ